MDPRSRLIPLAAALLLAMPAAADPLLTVDFEGLPVDQPVPVGGAALGQPIEVSWCSAVVRDGPLNGSCLEIADNDDFMAGYVGFEFLESAEATSGMLEIVCTLRFDSLDDYVLNVHEQGSAACDFTTLNFFAGGSFAIFDQNGYTAIGAGYEPGVDNTLRILHNLDAGTYGVWWNDAPVIADRAHGVVGRGIGSVDVGVGHDENLAGTLWLDDLRVSPDVSTGIEDIATASWSEVKRAFR